MSRDTDKAHGAETSSSPVIVDMRDRVPLLDDKSLATLHTNALRLKDSGTTRQRSSAESLLPLIEGELAARREKKRAEAPPKSVRVAKKKKAADNPADA
jgi:hypothetical protein